MPGSASFTPPRPIWNSSRSPDRAWSKQRNQRATTATTVGRAERDALFAAPHQAAEHLGGSFRHLPRPSRTTPMNSPWIYSSIGLAKVCCLESSDQGTRAQPGHPRTRKNRAPRPRHPAVHRDALPQRRPAGCLGHRPVARHAHQHRRVSQPAKPADPDPQRQELAWAGRCGQGSPGGVRDCRVNAGIRISAYRA